MPWAIFARLCVAPGPGSKDTRAPLPRSPHPFFSVQGGSAISSARGGFDEAAIIAFLKRHGINQLFVLGGDGTHRGAYRLAKAVAEKNLNVAVCGIPKTIDNDIG